MLSLSSQLAMEDMGGLFLGSSLLMDDPIGPLLDNEEELQQSQSLPQGRASSPLSPLSSSYADSCSSSPFSCLSPPPSPPPPSAAQLGSSKASDLSLPSLPWLSADELLSSSHMGADDGKGGFEMVT